jgi:hypothetical protein
VTAYSEEQIREAWEALPGFGRSHLETFLLALRGPAPGHEHDFTDTDMITVREFRAALKRMTDAGGWDAERFLRDISEHREPDYPVRTVWKDADGVLWYRVSSAGWCRLIQGSPIVPDSMPKRPLRRMDVMT